MNQQQTPLNKYHADLQRLDFFADPAQAQAVTHLNDLYHRLIAPVAPLPATTEWQRLWSATKTLFQTTTTQADIVPVTGLYFWGGVGRGKTYLVDTFYDCLPIERKMRIHFHRFMYRVHQQLQLLDGTEDPLEHVADNFKQQTDIICFDEFFVSDITDAMILATLLDALFRRGITLVATSNIAPDCLYRNGLQRARFLPAIALIEQHCLVVNIDAGIDYRLRSLAQAEIYYSPLGPQADANLARYFEQLSFEPRYYAKDIIINQRPITTQREASGVVQFSFHQLCQTARSQNDYIEIAQLYHTVLIADVMVMKEQDAARRFIAMVDEFYERNVTVIISAAVPLIELYTEGRLLFEFERCCSRLIEMQSEQYLARAHLTD
ncbi:cell division protein ZapE [Photobacterium kishitanii]|uniref:cell division protein ZapE n=1 Tax=Photobacterium kishitanii TaxID=318456 RepID=UPI0005D41C8D|nr:cell division protein ZapE [Photobacterium kishitanii]KJG10498.1 ATPase [Photobacterium kishitanii]PSU21890.1 cell division protein ZapE [Photobacterium kishitanii]PSV05194.1 cell division protein ZapE [Photobacterium kishitanii]PSV14574.1 cell division protein ZapE [Photobacterium kishitanii]PSV76014.1 cell division protein ZapE [Photobacterium kishitanii]